MKFFIILLEKAFKMIRNGVYFIVIAPLVAEQDNKKFRVMGTLTLTG